MKKIILLLLLLPIVAFAQDCKFEKNEIDVFYKTKIIKTQSRPIAFEMIGNGINFQYLYDKDPFIIIDVTFAKLEILNTNPNNNILLLLNDDSVITYNINEIAIGDLVGNGGVMSSTNFKFKFPTTLDQLKSIRNTGIKRIRFEYNDDSKEFIVSKKKFIDKMNAIIDCFVSEVEKV